MLDMTRDEAIEQHLCERCKLSEARHWHLCPYKMEINDDHESTCNCCDECTSECAMDV